MGISSKTFGVLPNGTEVPLYELANENGLTARVTPYGATLQALVFRGADILLGFDTLGEYLDAGLNNSYQGATVGRYANRIAGGKFSLNGAEYSLAKNNDGVNHLHGGDDGFNKKLWSVAETVDGGEPSITFAYSSPDGEEGYPSALDVRVTYAVTAEDALRIAYRAKAHGDTVLNLTNHAYFNLNGVGSGDVLDTVMQIDADGFTPVSGNLIPTGEILPVEGTPLDFRVPKPIGRDINADFEQLRFGGGFDHNFVLNGKGFRRAAKAFSPKSGVTLECRTDQPGMQLYTGNVLDADGGKNGKPMRKHDGFCLETQKFPDSPNHPNFPSAVLRSGEVFESVTEYRVS